MNTVKTHLINSVSLSQTEDIGERLGRQLKGGEVIELVSDLGGGKTALVRGIAKGMGSSDNVGSPTFMISKVYKAKALELHHFDFYRLQEAGVVGDELAEQLHDPKVVVVVEWAQPVSSLLPADRIRITIYRDPAEEEKRTFEIECPESLMYVIKEL